MSFRKLLEEHYENKFDQYKLCSLMLFPTDDTTRDQWYLSNTIPIVLDAMDKCDINELDIPTYEIRTILNIPSKKELSKLTKNAAEKGAIAGKVLLYLYFMAQAKTKEPSLNKAVYICSQETKKTEPTIWNYWKAFNNVSHFWGSMVLIDRVTDINKSNMHDLFGREDINPFLSIANTLLQFGKDYIPTRIKNPEEIFKGKAINIPDSVKLHDMNISPDILPQAMQDALRKYPKKNYY